MLGGPGGFLEKWCLQPQERAAQRLACPKDLDLDILRGRKSPLATVAGLQSSCQLLPATSTRSQSYPPDETDRFLLPRDHPELRVLISLRVGPAQGVVLTGTPG